MSKLPRSHNRHLQRHFLKEWRKFRGYTQEQAAEMLGMDRSNLSKIENAKVPYDQELLERAAEAYRCEVADLIVRDPTKPDAPWSIWNTLKPDQQVTAVKLLKALRDDDQMPEHAMAPERVASRLRILRSVLGEASSGMFAKRFGLDSSAWQRTEMTGILDPGTALQLVQKVPGLTLAWLQSGDVSGLDSGLAKDLADTPGKDARRAS